MHFFLWSFFPPGSGYGSRRENECGFHADPDPQPWFACIGVYLGHPELLPDELAGPLGLPLGEEPAPVPVHNVKHLPTHRTNGLLCIHRITGIEVTLCHIDNRY